MGDETGQEKLNDRVGVTDHKKNIFFYFLVLALGVAIYIPYEMREFLLTVSLSDGRSFG